jgi:hypothetical protein
VFGGDDAGAYKRTGGHLCRQAEVTALRHPRCHTYAGVRPITSRWWKSAIKAGLAAIRKILKPTRGGRSSIPRNGVGRRVFGGGHCHRDASTGWPSARV